MFLQGSHWILNNVKSSPHSFLWDFCTRKSANGPFRRGMIQCWYWKILVKSTQQMFCVVQDNDEGWRSIIHSLQFISWAWRNTGKPILSLMMSWLDADNDGLVMTGFWSASFSHKHWIVAKIHCCWQDDDDVVTSVMVRMIPLQSCLRQEGQETDCCRCPLNWKSTSKCLNTVLSAGAGGREQSEAHIMSDVSDWWLVLTMMALTWWLEVLLKRRILHFVMTGFGFWTCVKHSRNFLLFSSDWSDFGRRWRWLRTDCHVRGWHSPQVLGWWCLTVGGWLTTDDQ